MIRPLLSTTVVMSGADVTAGLYPRYTDMRGNNPPSMFAHADTSGMDMHTTSPIFRSRPFQ